MRITSKILSIAASAIIGLSLAAQGIPSASAQNANQPPKQFGPRLQQGQAQGQPQGQVPAAETIATHGDWVVQCDTPQKTADGKTPPKQCGIVQNAKYEKNPRVGLTLVITKMKQGDKTVTSMRVMAPIGVFLPTGVALEIDGAAVGRVPFTSCLPRFCMALAEASPDTLAKLKKGKAANFIIYEAPGMGMPMPISLKGFSDALGELDKL